MRYRRRFVWGLVALAALAFLLTLVFPPNSQPSKKTIRPSPGSRIALPRPAPPPTPPRSAPPQRKAPSPTSSLLPKQPPRKEDASQTTGGEHAEAEAADTGTLPEKGRATRALPATRENLVNAMQDIVPDIADCVDEWADVLELDTALDGKLSVELTLSTEGLEDVALVDVDNIPVELLTCFGGVMYTAEWPLPDEEPLVLRYPFRVIDDGGEIP